MIRIKLGTGRIYVIREGLGDKRENAIIVYAEENGLKLIWHENEFALEGTTEQLYAALYHISERWTLLVV